MKLYARMMKPFRLIEKAQERDGEGGTKTTYTRAGIIYAALDQAAKTAKSIAEAERVEATQGAIFDLDAPIARGTLLEDMESGAIYRVMTDAERTPNGAAIFFKRAEVKREEGFKL